MSFWKRKKPDLAFEESLGEDWSKDFEVVEVPLGNQPFFYAGIAIFLVGVIVMWRIAYLNIGNGIFYAARAEANQTHYRAIPAPRGLVLDRNGVVLAKNKAVFTATLDVKEFLSRRELEEQTLSAIERALRIPRDEMWVRIHAANENDFLTPIVLDDNLDQSEIVELKSINLPTIVVESDFEREYPKGSVFSSVVGYTGRVTSADLKRDKSLASNGFIGKAGVESYYDKDLQGAPGVVSWARDARGNVVGSEKKQDPLIGKPLRLTIDAEFQEYLHRRLGDGLVSLGRKAGLAVALDPQSGEVLALVSFPSFDNNALSGSGRDEEKLAILNSPDKPLFNRAVAGMYNPGSTMKPLVGIAALREGVIDAERTIFSPGYLEIPNPYNPDAPTRYADWRYQGDVNLASALAQSSNVYFYTVGGGTKDMKGLGISVLREWWKKFRLGTPTGIDLPGEAAGFLPSPEWKEEKTKRPWLLGDTYNVSIGQGDLLVNPLQLISFVAAIATGGKLYRPVVNLNAPHPAMVDDLSSLDVEMREVRKGMRQTITSPLGTIKSLIDLPFVVEAKTGTAQIQNNTKTNAIFVGYAPAPDPAIALIVLVENSKEGSANTIPIAKDALRWYYENRLKVKN